ncbi:phospholipase DDHD1-like [Pollicipes pollicipes]|uniref:phospholipase DDHD1-like n=1 Tax=Pollicipes pollicipes TaxID=41117 RepID=UPI001884D1B7|nr:phospholipase DDHD1-like [Pollicipes pollicipes]
MDEDEDKGKSKDMDENQDMEEMPYPGPVHGQMPYPGPVHGQMAFPGAAHHQMAFCGAMPAQMPYGGPAAGEPAAHHSDVPQQPSHGSPSRIRLQMHGSAGVAHVANGVDGVAGAASDRVLSRLGRSLYWSDEQFAVTRGAWFYDGSWEPLDEAVAAIHHVEFDKFVVVWYSNGDVAVHSGRVLSKVMRGLYQKLGFEGAGEPLRRSYPVPAVWEDRLPDITHLIFVVHGIGQKMDSSSIIKNTASMRSIGQPLRDKHFGPAAGRAEFIPVEWRSSLRLDAGMIDAVTPHQMLGLRQMLNDSFMDIMYYTSPLYRDELIAGLRRALNTVYANFSRHYPRFEARGGRVSVVAHSLGCVILHDLVTGWRGRGVRSTRSEVPSG